MQTKTALILFVAIVAVGALAYFATRDQVASDVPIETDYGSKIVYTTDTQQDTEPFIQHCTEQGGTFNACGSTCEPGAAFCAEVCAYTCENIGENQQVDTSDWVTYTNNEFEFTVQHPTDWKVLEYPENDIMPGFNIVPESVRAPERPYTHHDAVAQVSIFPEGIPTEGVFGEQAESVVAFAEDPQNARDYVLDDGTPWATFANFRNPPMSWGQAGFLWGSIDSSSLDTQCLRDGEPVTQQQCDVMTGSDTIVRSGDVDEQMRAEIEAILASFKFMRDQSVNQKDDLVRLNSPQAGDSVSSPLTITGEARGQWYFEADFPVTLTDWDGRIIAEGIATAQGEWMTEEYVPFEAELTFESPYSAGDPDFMRRGSLILHKDNPSGLPENDNALEVTVYFE